MRPKPHNKIVVEKRWLTVAEVQQYLGFANHNTQQEWRDSGLLPYHQIGRIIVYDKSDVDRLVEKHRVTPVMNINR